MDQATTFVVGTSVLGFFLATRDPFPRADAAAPRPAPSDAELQKSYEALRADRIERNRFEARRSLISEVLLLALSGGLFLGHWRWLRRLGAEALQV